jgi:outer membrane receptor for ferrienterochelin and colicin
MLSNQIFKYQGNQNDVPEAKLFDLTSREAENKVRVEYTFRKAGYKFNFGTNYEFARYTNKTFRRLESEIPIPPFEYDALLKMQKYGFFAQVSKRYFDDKLSVSAGLRADANNYSKLMNNPLKQLSPRLSLSYNINDSWSVSANTGLYYQFPVYTLLGYKNQAGEFQNKNTLKYIKSAHYVAGVAYTTTFNTKFSVEGFYKKYSNYPLLTQKGISFANEGGDYGVVGDEPADATSKGKAYGVEFLAQQKLYKGLFGIVSYTYYRSMFTDATGKYAPASWDNQHILNIALGYKFKKNWELGARWVISGGQPYTPFDIDFSSNKNVWDVRGRGVPDYQNVNSERLKPYTQLDVRVDKKWFFKKWNLNLYLDLTNVYMAAQDLPDDLVLVTDNNGVPLTNPDDESKYQTKLLNSDSGNLLPTIGVVVGF